MKSSSWSTANWRGMLWLRANSWSMSSLGDQFSGKVPELRLDAGAGGGGTFIGSRIDRIGSFMANTSLSSVCKGGESINITPLSTRLRETRCRSMAFQNGSECSRYCRVTLSQAKPSRCCGACRSNCACRCCNRIDSSRPIVAARPGEKTSWRSGTREESDMLIPAI